MGRGWIALIVYVAGILLTTRGVLLWDKWQEHHPRRRLAGDDPKVAILCGLVWPGVLYFGALAGAAWLLWKAASVGVRR